MGKKLDALFHRNLKASKLKATLNLAISRLAFLKKQRRARLSVSNSDVLQLIYLGLHERALLRVELVIKEQSMLDAFDIMEYYCHLLIDRDYLIEQEKACPEELKEAVSSLIYAATRCGEFPELQEIRILFTSWYGKEFATLVVQLRDKCGVSPKMIQKLSTRMTSSRIRMKVLKEIAAENDIVLQLEDVSLEISHEKIKTDKAQKPHTPSQSGDFDMACVAADLENVEGFLDRERDKDVVESAFKSESEEETGLLEDRIVKGLKQVEDFGKRLATIRAESANKTLSEAIIASDELPVKLQEREIYYYESEDENKNQGMVMFSRTHDSCSNTKLALREDRVLDYESTCNVKDDAIESKIYSPAHKSFPLRTQAGLKSGKENENIKPLTGNLMTPGADGLSVKKKATSVRTRRTFGS